MKAGHVAQVVGAVADCMEARHKAASVTNDTHGIKLRLEALENLVGVMTDAMLSGTSADPEAGKSAPAAKSGAKRVRR